MFRKNLILAYIFKRIPLSLFGLQCFKVYAFKKQNILWRTPNCKYFTTLRPPTDPGNTVGYLVQIPDKKLIFGQLTNSKKY